MTDGQEERRAADGLDGHFAAARARRPRPEARLVEAVVADAMAEAGRRAAAGGGRRWPATAALAASLLLGIGLGAAGLAPAPAGAAWTAAAWLAAGEWDDFEAAAGFDADAFLALEAEG